MRYSAGITAGALKVPESRVIAGLLLREVIRPEWRTAIYAENVLQARSPKTAKRLSVLIVVASPTSSRPLWKLIRDGSVVEATHACLAAAVKAATCSATFFDLVVRDQYRTFKEALARRSGPTTSRTVAAVIPTCRNGAIRPSSGSGLPCFTHPGRGRLHRLHEDPQAPGVHIVKPVLRYLEQHDEQYAPAVHPGGNMTDRI